MVSRTACRRRNAPPAPSPEHVAAEDGTLWFPTIQGLASLNPARLNLNTNPPPVVIEAVLVDGAGAELRHAARRAAARP